MKQETKLVAIILAALIVFLSGFGLGATRGITIKVEGGAAVQTGGTQTAAPVEQTTATPVQTTAPAEQKQLLLPQQSRQQQLLPATQVQLQFLRQRLKSLQHTTRLLTRQSTTKVR